MKTRTNLNIRTESTADFRLVEELTREAFWNVYVPGCNEHFMLHSLRCSPDFVAELSLVAEVDGQIVGHIAYTRAYILHDDGHRTPSLCFGPLSVWPAWQNRGVGGALIRASLEKARVAGHEIVCIMGDPRYYRRFGFRSAERYDLRLADGRFAAAQMALELHPGALTSQGGWVVESAGYAIDDPAAFEAFDARFPAREKGHRPSQDFFSLMCTMIYD